MKLIKGQYKITNEMLVNAFITKEQVLNKLNEQLKYQLLKEVLKTADFNIVEIVDGEKISLNCEFFALSVEDYKEINNILHDLKSEDSKTVILLNKLKELLKY